MIKINLNLFVTLSKYLPNEGACMEVESGTSLSGLVKLLKIPKDQVKLVFVNGKKQPDSYVLQDDDRVGIFPPVGGG